MPDYNNPKLLIMILPKTIEKQSLNILINTNHVEIFDGENTVSWLVNKLGLAYKTSSLLINKEKIVDPANCNESLNEGDVVEIKKGSKQVVSIKNVGIKKFLLVLFLKKIKLIKKILNGNIMSILKCQFFIIQKKYFLIIVIVKYIQEESALLLQNLKLSSGLKDLIKEMSSGI